MQFEPLSQAHIMVMSKKKQQTKPPTHKQPCLSILLGTLINLLNCYTCLLQLTKNKYPFFKYTVDKTK